MHFFSEIPSREYRFGGSKWTRTAPADNSDCTHYFVQTAKKGIFFTDILLTRLNLFKLIHTRKEFIISDCLLFFVC